MVGVGEHVHELDADHRVAAVHEQSGVACERRWVTAHQRDPGCTGGDEDVGSTGTQTDPGRVCDDGVDRLGIPVLYSAPHDPCAQLAQVVLGIRCGRLGPLHQHSAGRAQHRAEQPYSAVQVGQSSGAGVEVAERPADGSNQRLSSVRARLEERIGRDPQASTPDELVDMSLGARVQLVGSNHPGACGDDAVTHSGFDHDQLVTRPGTDPDSHLLGTWEPGLRQDPLDRRVRHQATVEHVHLVAAPASQSGTLTVDSAAQNSPVGLPGQVLTRLDRNLTELPDPGQGVAHHLDLQLALQLQVRVLQVASAAAGRHLGAGRSDAARCRVVQAHNRATGERGLVDRQLDEHRLPG